MSPRKPRPPKVRPPDPDRVDAQWRLFLAAPLPPDVRAVVRGIINELAPKDWPVRWVDPETAHLTLHFLGDTPPERAELLRLALPAVVARHAAFTLRTGDLGAFPSVKRPRVLWLGLYGPAHRLAALHEAVGEALRDLDFPVEEGPFHPHITLGRVRNQGTERVPLRAMPEELRALADPATGVMTGPPAVTFPVREVVLVRSYLGSGAPRYETVARFPLLTQSGQGR
ncbi:MAG: RNA 2',3'-cyclic phosphodiesterase [Thermomicrobiales bacterium]|nr:RNA 2',3'-cyclic phosphodiesterase [Thermomicrobiales bacterium]